MHIRKISTKGQMEAEISEAVIRFEKEFIGRGPLETKTYIMDDIVLIRMKGPLTKAELRLTKSDRRATARDLLKQMRSELVETGREILETSIKGITKCKVKSLHSDISTITGEKVFVFTLDRVVELPE